MSAFRQLAAIRLAHISITRVAANGQEQTLTLTLHSHSKCIRPLNRRDFLAALIGYTKGKATSIPEISSKPKTFEKYIKTFYTAVVLMNQGEVDAVIKIGDQNNYRWNKRFFSKTWDRDEFHQLIMQAGLVDYWRKSGKWGDMCRPRGEDDFECGVFD